MNTTYIRRKTLSRRAWRGLIAIVLALSLAMFGLAYGAPAAHAAPPEVTASENPVVIPEGQTTKEITLTWSLLPITPLATLTVTESGTPAPVLDQQVNWPPGTGTVKLKVTYGKTYTAQLKAAITNQPLGAPLTITTERPPKRADELGCRLECITNVGVEPHGGWAQFTIETSEKAIITLEASKTKPNANGTWSTSTVVTAATPTIFPTQNWTPPLSDLDPNTTYHYVVRAHDTNGHEQVKTGTFKTLTRQVDVTFAEIQMIDDSDGAGAGDCDCFFWFSAGNSPDTPYGDLNNPKHIGSGTPPVHPNITVTATNAPNEIQIRASGNDDDTDFGEFCPAGIGPRYQGWGNIEECLDWAGRFINVSVSRQGQDTAPWEVDEVFTESFSFNVGGDGLKFQVLGTYKVSYVP